MVFHSLLFSILLLFTVTHQVRNAEGNTLVKEPPFKTTKPQIDSISADSVRLLWRAGYDGNSPIRYFNIGYKFTANGTVVENVMQSYASGRIRKDVVSGLIPYTKYQFRIQAVNSVGVSPWSGFSYEIRTLEIAPSYKLKQVKGAALNDHTIGITWEEPPKSTHNGLLRGYYVAWKYAGVSSGSFTIQKVTPATTRTLNITKLLFNSPYEIKVQMFNDAGSGPFSDAIVIKTMERIPSSAPGHLAVRNVSSRSVELEWDEPPEHDWNGEITQYIVRFWVLNKKENFKDRVAKHDPSLLIQTFIVTNLEPYTQYTFKVLAQNSAGGSPYSNTVHIRTVEDIPSSPQRLQIVDQFSDTIRMKWVRPREVNGVLVSYVVKYWQASGVDHVNIVEVAGDAVQAEITGLQDNTSYTIEVAARTNAGLSKSAKIDGQTLDAAVVPSPPTSLRFLAINLTKLILTWQEGRNGNSPIMKYIIQGNNETYFANDHNSQWFDALVISDPFKIDNSPPVIIENLLPGTTYRFRVIVHNKVGASPVGLRSSDVTTMEAAPLSPPINVQVKPAQYPDHLLVTWEIPPVETWNSRSISYTLVLQEVGDLTNKTRYTTTGIRGTMKRFLVFVRKFTKYEIRMKTVNHAGQSPYSRAIIGHILEHAPLSPPINVQVNPEPYPGELLVTWDIPPVETWNSRSISYTLVLQEVGDLTNETRYTTTGIRGNMKRLKLFALKKFTKYEIRMKTINNVGQSPYSPAIVGQTLEHAPLSPPINVQVKPGAYPGELLVTWEIPPVETWNSRSISYTLVLQEIGDFTNETRYTTTGIRGNMKRFKLFALKNFTKYVIKMKTVNHAGQSPYSAAIIGQTLEHEPPCWKRRNNLKVKYDSRLLADLTGPTCDEDGYLQFVQCRFFRGCYCVNKNGKRTSKYYRGLGRSQPPCTKAGTTLAPKQSTSLTTQLVKPSMTEPSCWKRINKLRAKYGNRFLPDLTGSRCDKHGYFKAMQCRLFRGCYCVNKNGKRTSKFYRGLRRSSPPCSQTTTTLPPRQNTHPATQLKPTTAGN